MVGGPASAGWKGLPDRRSSDLSEGDRQPAYANPSGEKVLKRSIGLFSLLANFYLSALLAKPPWEPESKALGM